MPYIMILSHIHITMCNENMYTHYIIHILKITYLIITTNNNSLCHRFFPMQTCVFLSSVFQSETIFYKRNMMNTRYSWLLSNSVHYSVTNDAKSNFSLEYLIKISARDVFHINKYVYFHDCS